jgi:hypothetical protein
VLDSRQMPELENYEYRGARALVLLHERHLRECLATWRRAKAGGVMLPATDDPSYRSLETLLVHIFRAARGYLTWICQQLELPEPDLPQVPEPGEVEARADDFLTGLLAGWRLPLRDVPPERFEGPTYVSRWGDGYSIDSMLEHAVMHPIRHSFQLNELLAKSAALGESEAATR